ncbi:hypothetical protein [Chamaesiphon sp. OTE_75_metabat_556]|nr:hypothetical protein [Chamaesiphon sp. OTE_75_metabat_556]
MSSKSRVGVIHELPLLWISRSVGWVEQRVGEDFRNALTQQSSPGN